MSHYNIQIDQYCPKDREAIRLISYKTSFLERPELFINNREIIADALTLYFTDKEPESCFVARNNGQTVGYLTGSLDAIKMKKVYKKYVVPKLVKLFFKTDFLLKKNNLYFTWQCIKSFLKKEFSHPDFSKDFPAILHLNIEKDFRGLGIGNKLLTRYCDYLNNNHIKGVHLSTASEEAKNFFLRHGFSVLLCVKCNYLNNSVKENINGYILGLSFR